RGCALRYRRPDPFRRHRLAHSRPGNPPLLPALPGDRRLPERSPADHHRRRPARPEFALGDVGWPDLPGWAGVAVRSALRPLHTGLRGDQGRRGTAVLLPRVRSERGVTECTAVKHGTLAA